VSTRVAIRTVNSGFMGVSPRQGMGYNPLSIADLPMRYYKRQGAPKGRQSIARGVSPWGSIAHSTQSPVGAAVECVVAFLPPLRGSLSFASTRFPGLTPRAIDCRPVGALVTGPRRTRGRASLPMLVNGVCQFLTYWS